MKACATGPVHPISLAETQLSKVREDALSIKRKLRALFLGLILGIGSIAGMPMRVEEIENLMQSRRVRQARYAGTAPTIISST